MKKCFYVILAAAAIVASCAKTDLKEDQKFEPKDSATALFSGSIVQPNGLNTKTTLVDDQDNQVSIEWVENDEIKVYGLGTKAAHSFYADSKGTEVYFGCTSDNVSEVSAWLTSNDQYGYKAYYPAYTYPALPTVLDCKHKIGENEFVNWASLQNMPLVAELSPVSTPGHVNRKLSFSSPYAILQFTVPSTLDADKMEVYLNEETNYFVSVANFDKLEAENKVFYAPIPAKKEEGYDKLTFVAKKTGQEEAVATMSTYSGVEKIDPNTIYYFDFCNTLTIDAAGIYDLKQNGLDYKINISTAIDGEVTINAIEEANAPDSIFVNVRGVNVNNLTINAPYSHVEVSNGTATNVIAKTSNTTFVAKSSFHITTLTVEKGSVVVEGKDGNRNVDKIVISPDVQEQITINLEGVTTGDKVVIENQSSVELDIEGENYEEEEPVYIKVTSGQTDWSGDYILVYETEDGAARVFTGVDASSDFVEATISNNTITGKFATLTLESTDGGYLVKINGGENNGKYISHSANSNGLSIGTSGAVMTMSYDESVLMTNAGGAVMRYNKTSGQDRFRFYKSTSYTDQQPVQLYKLEEVPLVSIAISGIPKKTSYSVGEIFDTDGLTVTATYEDASKKDVTSSVEWTITPETLTAGTTSVTVKAKYNGVESEGFIIDGLSVKELSSISVKDAPTKITYNEGDNFIPAGLVITRVYSDESSDEYTYADHEDEFTFVPALDTPLTTTNNIVTITYSGKSVSQTITVNEKSALETMDAIFDAATEAGSTATDVKVKFGDWVVSGVKNNNAYLTDNNGKGLIIYTSNHGFDVGDVLSGTVNCEVKLYNGAAELMSLTSTTEGLTVTNGGVVTPATIAIAELSGVNTGAVVAFEKLQYNGSVFSDGENAITPFGTFMTLPTLTSGRNYKVTGVYIQYKDTKEIAPRTAEDFKPIEEPFLTAKANKTSVSAAGETITITVDTNVEDWSVKSDNTEFVVGAKDGKNVPVVVSENTSTTDGRTATITVSADGVEDVIITLTQAKKDMPHDDEVFFHESFNQCEGTGGNDGQWSGSIASSNLTADNAGWAFANGAGASKCAKFGTGSKQGSAETPEITITSSSAKLMFKAGAWNGDGNTLNISATNATLNQESVTLVNNEWTLYNTVELTNITGPVKIKFIAKNASSNRFFLDEVYVYYGATPEMPKDNPIITSTDKTITLSGDPASASQDLKEMFSSNSTGEFTYSLESSSATASISGSTFTATAKGTYTVVANQAATDSYNAGSATATITVNEASQGGTVTWTRVTTIDELTAGGTFIMGYEATAKSGVIVPLRSADCNGKTTANGYFNTGTTTGSSTDGTIDISKLTESADYEVYISSPASGKINIQMKDKDGSYYGATSGGSTKNTGRLYTSGNSAETNLTPEFSSEKDNQFKLTGAVSGQYKYLKYNTSSPRFAYYNSAGSNIVFYKKSE